MSEEFIIIVTSNLPISEVRRAIPLGIIKMNMPLSKVYLLSVLENMIPVIPLLYLLQPVSEYLRRFRFLEVFFNWLFYHTKKKATIVEKFEAIGLMLFVSIPLPITGAWTGCVAATLFKLKLSYALVTVFLGIIISGLIVTFATLTGITIFYKI